MGADTREYDMFGPWVDEVRTEHDLPRLFRGPAAALGVDLDAARLVLKVPRNIARRDAHPAMDLYDHLLVLGGDRLTVLSRDEGEGDGRAAVSVRHSRYADVVAIDDDVTLLEGRLRVHTRDGDVLTVAYNGAACENPRRLAEELRQLSIGCAADRRVVLPEPDSQGPRVLDQSALGVDDIGVVNAHRAVARTRPDLRVVAWQQRQVVRPRAGGATGAWRRVSHAVKPMTLHAAIVAADRDTVEVFGRDWLVRGKMADYAMSRLVLLRHALDGLEAREHPVYPAATVVSLLAGQARLRVVVPTGSTALERLRALVTGVVVD